MMKKLLAIVLSVLMIGTLAVGCGSRKKTGTTEETWPISGATHTIYVPAKAGGGTDLAARVLANALQEKTGETFVVVNQNEGGGVVAYESVRTSQPDGRAFLLQNTGFFCSYYSGAYEYSPLKDFSAIGYMFRGSSQVLLVRSDAAWDTVEDLVDAAKNNPNSITYGCTNGGSAELVCGMLESSAGIELKTVDASSETDKITAILGGNIDLVAVNTKSAQQYVNSGDAKILGVLTAERDQKYPDYPTIVEQGYDVVWAQDQILFTAPGTDEKICQAIADLICETMKDESVLAQLADAGWDLDYTDFASSSKKLADTDAMVKSTAQELGW